MKGLCDTAITRLGVCEACRWGVIDVDIAMLLIGFERSSCHRDLRKAQYVFAIAKGPAMG